MKRVLLNCVGMSDPYSDYYTEKPIPGPILTLLEEQAFDDICLFWVPGSGTSGDMNTRVSMLKKKIQEIYPGTRTRLYPLSVENPTNYLALSHAIIWRCQEVMDEFGGEEVDYTAQISSGTPQMQWVWVSLALSGMLPARLVSIKPRYMYDSEPPYAEEIKTSEITVFRDEHERRIMSRMRELENENQKLKAELAVLRSSPAHTGPVIASGPAVFKEGFDLNEYLKAEKKRLYAEAIRRHPDNASEAARLLGVRPHAFRKEAENLGLRPRRKRNS